MSTEELNKLKLEVITLICQLEDETLLQKIKDLLDSHDRENSL